MTQVHNLLIANLNALSIELCQQVCLSFQAARTVGLILFFYMAILRYAPNGAADET